jgi:hypothetical protein
MIFRKMGFHIGSDLNKALDNLWFSFLFRHPQILRYELPDVSALWRIFQNATCHHELTDAQYVILNNLTRNRDAWSTSWLKNRVDNIIASSKIRETGPRRIVWKEPNTHIILDRLYEILPDLKYIHVVRNGLDMAFSNNQHQMRNWGKELFKLDDIDKPEVSLKFWCLAQKRVIRITRKRPEQFLMVKYEDLCFSTRSTVQNIFSFIDHQFDNDDDFHDYKFIKPSQGIGRFRGFPGYPFSKEDVEYVRSLGFPVDF